MQRALNKADNRLRPTPLIASESNVIVRGVSIGVETNCSMCTAAVLGGMPASERGRTRKQDGASRCCGRAGAHFSQSVKRSSRFCVECSKVCDYASFIAAGKGRNQCSRRGELQANVRVADTNPNYLLRP